MVHKNTEPTDVYDVVTRRNPWPRADWAEWIVGEGRGPSAGRLRFAPRVLASRRDTVRLYDKDGNYYEDMPGGAARQR